jgi:predicted transglutaminase-like cysteine proteinase
MRWSRLCSNAVVLFFVSVMPAFAALPPATSNLGLAPIPGPMPGLFNTQEIFHGDTSPFKQWTDMLGRAHAEFAAGSTACTSRRPECAINEWSQLVSQLAPLPLRDKVIRANAVLNGVPYVPSTRNWGRALYWEAPLEFLADGGQCQDYAIAKYMALRQAGVAADQMRIVVLRAAARGEDHAVLVVNVEGEALMLDNLRTGVVPANSVASYHPYYSINETGWWQHKAATVVQTAQR